jgi:dimethylaniline monooxygenase (N-oxide forming)
MNLHDYTFHPELPGLAFAGLYDQVGPLLPVLELQARWVAYTFAGMNAAPTRSEMLEGLARSRAARRGPENVLDQPLYNAIVVPGSARCTAQSFTVSD